MAENRNMYGGHDVSDYVPPTSGTSLSMNQDLAPTLNLEYLEKVSSILDRIERMEAFVAHDDERRKAYEEQRTKDITALHDVIVKTNKIADCLWTAGKNVDEMLDEIKEIRKNDISLKLTNDTQKYFDAVPQKIFNMVSGYLNEKLETMGKVSEEASSNIGESIKKAATIAVNKINQGHLEYKKDLDEFKIWCIRWQSWFIGAVLVAILTTSGFFWQCSSANTDRKEAQFKIDSLQLTNEFYTGFINSSKSIRRDYDKVWCKYKREWYLEKMDSLRKAK